jgi:hypothetical protein
MALTLEWACGFEQFGTTTDVGRTYFPYNILVGGGGVNTNAYYIRTPQPSGVTARSLQLWWQIGLVLNVSTSVTRHIGFGYYHLGAISGAAIFQFSPAFNANGAANSYQADGVRILAAADGTLSIVKNNGGTVLATSAAGALPTETMVWISVSCNPSSGWVTIAVNGTIAVTATLNFSFAMKYILFESPSYTNYCSYIDDVVIYTSDGSDTSTTLVPPRSVWTCIPTGPGDVTQWTKTGGATNWQSVASLTYQTANYVSTSTTNNRDLYTVSALPVTPTTIDGVLITAAARKADSANRTLTFDTRVSGTDTFSAALPIQTSASYWYISTTQTTNPAGTAWTSTDLSSLQIGIKAT